MLELELMNCIYSHMDGRKLLDGQTAVVTGGSRGIGAAISLALAANGARVAILHHDEEPQAADSLCRRITALGSECLPLRADVSDAGQVRAAFAAIGSRWSRVTLLVNNAGISTRSPFAALTEAEWDLTHGVNLKSHYLCSREAVELMDGAGGGIINISSVRARRAFAADSAYIATKGGIEAFTRALAVELAPRGIRVNAIAPGAIETDFNRARLQDPALYAATIRLIPLQRVGQPADVAGAALFLASPMAAFITGAVIPVDGGQVVQG